MTLGPSVNSRDEDEEERPRSALRFAVLGFLGVVALAAAVVFDQAVAASTAYMLRLEP